MHRGTDLLVFDGGEGGSFVFVFGSTFSFSLFFSFFLSRFDFVYNQVLLQILNLSIIRHAVGFAAWLRRCAR